MRKVVNQHGDVILYDVACVPEGAERVEVVPGFILERGEGVHMHIFPDVQGIEVYEKDGKTYVLVKDVACLDHEEHGKQKLSVGIREKGIENVWDYEKEETRKVID